MMQRSVTDAASWVALHDHIMGILSMMMMMMGYWPAHRDTPKVHTALSLSESEHRNIPYI